MDPVSRTALLADPSEVEDSWNLRIGQIGQVGYYQ